MGVTVTAFGPEITGADILQQADVSLYKAKNNGRNRTEVFSAAAAGHSSGI
jgi:PleD family two-component response regulator